mmetsp:Transcript_39647/g.95716  ORF Transcript_39647/g.95716 Transcript_39647/m.95716 type:complete len:306 (-) Transcript_39647:203-1120(-)
MAPKAENRDGGENLETEEDDTATDVVAVDDRRQSEAFDTTTSKGAEGGLFRECMSSIRSSHITANRLRMGIVVAGMFSDVSMYSEVIALFYLVTKATESKAKELSTKQNDDIATKLLSLGYHFTPDYEQDLKFLYETKLGLSPWQDYVMENIYDQNDSAVRSYVEHIESMTTGAELAGAVFCLWGALIIGGGAAAKPRAESLVKQKDSLKLFQSVTGPGRNQRKNEFVSAWDTLVADNDNDDKTVRDIIVKSCDFCMQQNNDLIASVKKEPWWMKYICGGMMISSIAVAAFAVGLYQFSKKSTIV